MYLRKCKQCGNDVSHKNEKNLKRALKEDRVCVSCAQKVAKLGSNNGMFGKKHKDTTIKKIKEKRKHQIFTEETRDKLSIINKRRLEEYNHWIGRAHTDETKKKLKLIAANRIHDNKWHPSFNVNACGIIEKYGKDNGYNFQHALNGGEFFIRELGYWVDGYDIEKNVVIEYYETAHKQMIEKDEIRIEKIKNTLNCEVIILKEWE
jgi:hypothetical protein